MSSAPQFLAHDGSKQYAMDELESIFRTIKAEKARPSKCPHISARPDSGRPQRPVHLPHAASDHDPSALHAEYVATNRPAHRRPAAEGVRPAVCVNIQPVARAEYHPMSQGATAHVQNPARSRGSSQRTQGLSNAQQAAGVDSDGAPPAHPPMTPLASSQVKNADPHAYSQRASMVKPPSRPPRRTGATVSSQSNDFIRYHGDQFQHSTDNVNWREFISSHPDSAGADHHLDLAVKYADIRDGMLGRAKRGSTYSELISSSRFEDLT